MVSECRERERKRVHIYEWGVSEWMSGGLAGSEWV